MSTASNVTVGKPRVAGGIYRAPLGTALPTDAKTALNSAFVEMGYVSEDGVTNSLSPDVNIVKAWGGDVVYATDNGKTDTFAMTLIETLKADVLKAVHGSDNVSGTSAENGIAVTVNNDPAEEAIWVIDMIQRGGVLKRIVIPDGKITDIGDIVYKDDEAVGYEVTVTAMADASGNTHYEYMTVGTATSGT